MADHVIDFTGDCLPTCWCKCPRKPSPSPSVEKLEDVEQFSIGSCDKVAEEITRDLDLHIEAIPIISKHIWPLFSEAAEQITKLAQENEQLRGCKFSDRNYAAIKSERDALSAQVRQLRRAALAEARQHYADELKNVERENQALSAQVQTLQNIMYEVREFIDGQIDVVDGDYGVPAPNRAMILAQEIDEVLDGSKGRSDNPGPPALTEEEALKRDLQRFGEILMNYIRKHEK